MNLKFVWAIVLIFSMAACRGKGQKGVETNEPGMEDMDAMDDGSSKTKKVTDRDYSIDASNAYNDMFLDSLAMEKYITERELTDKKIARRIRSFYNARNYQYAWFSSEGLTEQARFFWNQYDYAVDHLKDTTLASSEFYKKAARYMNQEDVSVSKNNTNILQTEFGLTEHFIRYINSTYEKGYVKRKEQEKFIPIKKLNPLGMADSLLNKKHKDDKYYEDVNEMYAGLKKNLELYYNVAKTGGWDTIKAIKSPLKKGDSVAVVAAIKRRLQLTQDMSGTDTSWAFNDSLEAAVRKFQARHGYKQDGIVSKQLVKDMNVPAIERLKQILLNMDRMRWMPQSPAGHLIIVNLPEFKLHLMNGKEEVFDMAVVVGKVGNNTMMFNGDLNQVIFSPYWNIPQSIINEEIEPAIARNPNYLANKNMERTSYGIRQRPGPGNALGKVKFIFPNSFNMYFHDTPAKSLFEQDKRAFSHGCIRLAEPQKFAEWLLRNDPNWPTEKIVKAMNQTHETPVKLKDPIPVFIIYYTSWIDKNGLINFRDDVYNHDKVLMEKMFTAR